MAMTAVEIQKKAVQAVAIYRQDQALYDAYHGGVPVALMVAMAQGESGGRMNAPGDASIGEFGIFQVTSYIDKKSGRWQGTEAEYLVPKDTRKNKVGNFFLAGTDFNAEAARLLLRFPGLIQSYTDLYKLSHLSFAVGRGGTYALLTKANLSPGPDVYGRLLSWAAAEHARGRLPQLSKSQPPAKVWRRLVAVDDRWKVAVASGLPMSAGPPVIPALPSSIKKFTIPKALQGHIKQLAPGEAPALRESDLRNWTAPSKQDQLAKSFAFGGLLGAIFQSFSARKA